MVRKVRGLERQRTGQSALPAGRSPRLETWLTEWLSATSLRMRPSALSGNTVDEARRILAAAEDEPNGVAFMLAISLVGRARAVVGRCRSGCRAAPGAAAARAPELAARLRGPGTLRREAVAVPTAPRRRAGAGELKTKQSRRTLPLPEPLLVALRQHRRRQREVRIRAGTLWRDSGLVFTTVTGEAFHHVTVCAYTFFD